ncbi:hypothetical protein BU25DRAFT_70925 [Macroventuria anomochaeta]|uniref:Uncharacterized protein n=1 Tax=Macroventuria anomochaeta TaxID=301207 RepID=A0ACB6S1E5_9PLEO|nr:uncharacterized protein BU25DRAFT_70925 [Macroventuria anomochaeta]KAF2627209.1 hypothetical protein BU25DRAFT_70925 [Macroventuria anomochaeta]
MLQRCLARKASRRPPSFLNGPLAWRTASGAKVVCFAFSYRDTKIDAPQQVMISLALPQCISSRTSRDGCSYHLPRHMRKCRNRSGPRKERVECRSLH